MTIAAAIRGLLQTTMSPDVTAADDAGCVWRIQSPSILTPKSRSRRQQVNAIKHRILRALSASGTAVIYHHESPEAEQLPGRWSPAEHTGAWRVPADIDLTNPAVDHWLFDLGNWMMCSPDAHLGQPPDIARAPASRLLTWAQQRGIDVIVDSFHDDVSWVVILACESVLHDKRRS
jgi:hypothetical protein